MFDARILIPVTLAVLGIGGVLRADRTRALGTAALTAILIAVVVPSFSTSAPIAACAVLGPGAVLLVALIRCRSSLDLHALPWPAVGFLLWSGIAGSFAAPTKMVLLYAATTVLLLLLLIALSSIQDERFRRTAGWFFGGVLLFEVVAGALEEGFGLPALWPMPGGADLITHRVNSLVPLLPGRALGTVSQPIPFGLIVAFAALAFVVLARPARRSWVGLAAVLAVLGLSFSGSRSIVLALAVAIAAGVMLVALRTKHRTLVVAGTAVALLLACGAAIAWEVHSGATQTSSFQHRAGVLQSSLDLLRRPPLPLIFGSGYESIRGLFISGIVHGTPGIVVFDNEYVRTLAGLGLVGMALLVAAAAQAFHTGARPDRVMLVLLVISFASFDALSWRLVACLFVFVTGAASNRSLQLAGSTARSMPARVSARSSRHLGVREAGS